MSGDGKGSSGRRNVSNTESEYTGLRRRHSAPFDAEDSLLSNASPLDRTSPASTFSTSPSPYRDHAMANSPSPSPGSTNNNNHNSSTPHRSVTDPLAGRSNAQNASFSPRLDRHDEDRSVGRSNSTDIPRNVRFSEEIERIPLEEEEDHPRPSRRGVVSVRPHSMVGPLPPSQSSRGMRLSVDIPDSGPAPEPSILGTGFVRSPSGASDSQRGRNRGYSLRRSLFNRSMQTSEGPWSPIELSPIGSMASPAVADPAGPVPPPYQGQAHLDYDDSQRRPQRKKSSGSDAIVTVSPLVDDRDAYASDTKPLTGGQSSKTKLLAKTKGISALPNYDTWIKEKAARTKASRASKKVGSWYKSIQKHILRISELPPSKDGRHVDVDASRKSRLIDDRSNKPFIGNSIRSSRYTLWSFLPKQLYAQFSKLANFYFLCISILQLIPGLSTTGSYTTIIPLLVFVSISIAREGYDDLRRYRLDKEENNRETSVLHAYQSIGAAVAGDGAGAGPATPLRARSASAGEGGGLLRTGPRHWATTKWKDVQVGDIIKLERDQPAPADIVLLSSAGENGIAYIETMALDGETNLKSKSAVPALGRSCDTLEKLATVNAHIVVEDPNLDLYNFEGKVTVTGETAALSGNEVIYRGSILRNTSEITGCVVYTGEECKMRMNANKNPRIKAPTLQSLVNKIVVVIVLYVVCLAIFESASYLVWADERYGDENAWYLTSSGVGFGTVLVSFIIMFNTMIPLSLYVSLEIVKFWQMIIMNDVDMYDEVTDTPFECRTTTINEELGQISYIFSDKTGTLTDNSMKFRKLSVAGTAWLHDSDLKLDAIKRQKSKLKHRRSKGKKPARSIRNSISWDTLARRSSVNPFPHSEPEEVEDSVPQSPGWKSSARPAKSQAEMGTIEMIRYIQRKPFSIFARKARFFLLSMALCHTCLPETQDDGKINYQAASPDELALVQAAQELGFIAIDRKAGTLTVKTFPTGSDAAPQLDNYEILDVIEFSSKRKRMSVVVRLPDQRICVICKGADGMIMQRLRLSQQAIHKAIEIERKASKRKSMEASQVIARKSEAPDRRRSVASPVGRASLNFGGRRSMGGLGRASSVNTHTTPLRDQVDTWLSEREHDVDASVIDEDQDNYTPRPSGTFPRKSMAGSGFSRDSMIVDDEDDLIDEALVLDEQAIIDRTFQQINDFATEGLRTLLYGHRFLDDDEYKTWKKVYHDATTSLVDRQLLIEQAGELIEKELELGGATAIEDKLQYGVPEAIDKLRRANIKMWMLTGDKRETAINIGHSCRLIKDYSSITILDHETGLVEQSIAAAIVDISDNQVAHSVVVVDGQTLALIEDNSDLSALFLDLAVIADAVICCRASPSQKAGLVKAIRQKVKKSITLAIGDGANDIAMIQEAHVGIGITGKEGLQAARSSDYSIAQFRFLSKLLLVHGRWNYVRVSKYTVATFWKEMTFYMTQAMFQPYTGHSGTSLYESASLSMFNTLFTSLPVIILGIFEKDLSASTLLAVPELYGKGQRNGGFNLKIYLFWMAMAAGESALIFYIPYFLFASVTTDNFNVNDLFPYGDLTFTAVVVLVSLKLLGVEMHNRTIANAVVAFLSIGAWALWNLLLGALYVNNYQYEVKDDLFYRFGRSAPWWLSLIILIVCIIMLEIGVKSIKSAVYPSETDVFQELERDPATKERFEQAAALELRNSSAAFGTEPKPLSRSNTDARQSNNFGGRASTSAAAAVAAMRESNRQSMRSSSEREREVVELLRNRTRTIDDTQDDIDIPNPKPRVSIGVREVDSRETFDTDVSPAFGSEAGGPAGPGDASESSTRRGSTAAGTGSLHRTRSVGDLFKRGFGSVKRY